jgi:hypothetical protein
MNLNRTCITRVFSNPAVNRAPDTDSPPLHVPNKKTKRVSFDELDHHDDNIVGINWGSIGQTFLNIAKDIAKFVVTVLPTAKYKHYNGDEIEDDSATPVSTGMPYCLPPRFTSLYTTVSETDDSLIDLASVHLAYSVPTDRDRQQPGQLSFSRVVYNEIKTGDSRINNAHVIQLSISADVYIQKLIGIPRHRLNYLVNIHPDQFQPVRSSVEN